MERLAIGRNEFLRKLLQVIVGFASLFLRLQIRWRVARTHSNHHRLRQLYAVTPETPIVGYGPEVREAVGDFLSKNPNAVAAYTSGSTSRPKALAYTRTRLRALKRASFSVAARTIQRYGVRRGALFVLASLKQDDSLTSLLLESDRKGPGFIEGLVTPSFYLRAPALHAHLEAYGATAVRLWLLVLADPGILYSTNPSTLAVFLKTISDQWEKTTRFIRDTVRTPGVFSSDVWALIRRVAAPGWRTRFEAVAAAPAPLRPEEFGPSLRLYCCWDGGYVRPFLEQIKPFLPAPRFTHVPMYSMSTETVETLNVYNGDQVQFLPLFPGVLYEFLPEEAQAAPENLLPPWELEAGENYTMVVSDAYSLKRYHTDDLFACAGRVGASPDLRFLRRIGIGYSFTGEKLTGEQLTEAYDTLRRESPHLVEQAPTMTCFPSQPIDAELPGYVLVLAYAGERPSRPLDLKAVALRFDEILGECNRELRSKHESARLAPTRAILVPYDRLAAALDKKTSAKKDRERRAWESQFKLLPLYQRLYEDHALEEH